MTDYPKAGGFYASSSIAAGIKRPARVFDGVWPHVTGAGRLALNLRLAQPDCYPRQHEHHLYPSDQFPFA